MLRTSYFSLSKFIIHFFYWSAVSLHASSSTERFHHGPFYFNCIVAMSISPALNIPFWLLFSREFPLSSSSPFPRALKSSFRTKSLWNVCYSNRQPRPADFRNTSLTFSLSLPKITADPGVGQKILFVLWKPEFDLYLFTYIPKSLKSCGETAQISLIRSVGSFSQVLVLMSPVASNVSCSVSLSLVQLIFTSRPRQFNKFIKHSAFSIVVLH